MVANPHPLLKVVHLGRPTCHAISSRGYLLSSHFLPFSITVGRGLRRPSSLGLSDTTVHALYIRACLGSTPRLEQSERARESLLKGRDPLTWLHLSVLQVLRAPNIGGHRKWFCRKNMLPCGSHNESSPLTLCYVVRPFRLFGLSRSPTTRTTTPIRTVT